MRQDGDCSKCTLAATCGVDRAAMCAAMRATPPDNGREGGWDRRRDEDEEEEEEWDGE